MEMVVIDRALAVRQLEAKRDSLTSPRQRRMLDVYLEHLVAEIEGDVDRVMATVAPDPRYHVWVAPGDSGPKGFAGARHVRRDVRGEEPLLRDGLPAARGRRRHHRGRDPAAQDRPRHRAARRSVGRVGRRRRPRPSLPRDRAVAGDRPVRRGVPRRRRGCLQRRRCPRHACSTTPRSPTTTGRSSRREEERRWHRTDRCSRASSPVGCSTSRHQAVEDALLPAARRQGLAGLVGRCSPRISSSSTSIPSVQNVPPDATLTAGRRCACRPGSARCVRERVDAHRHDDPPRSPARDRRHESRHRDRALGPHQLLRVPDPRRRDGMAARLGLVRRRLRADRRRLAHPPLAASTAATWWTGPADPPPSLRDRHR